MASHIEIAAMRRALTLAALGPRRGPNPRVGCVIVTAAGETLGEGFHAGAGGPHAEVEALRAVLAGGHDATGATAVVTLEPCSHTGRTPPCTDALRAAGITRVVIAATDPNPEAAGGARVLRESGVDVETGVLAEESEALNRRWAVAMRRGYPFVTWKFAATLDGRSAAADGTSQWITTETARADVHALRAEADALVAGTGTVLTDDPHLTVRLTEPEPAGAHEPPLRVVVGLRDLPDGARVLDGRAPTLHLRTRKPREVLDDLHAREIRHVWLEGGPTLAAAFWREGLIDEVVAYLAPALLGAGDNAVADLGIRTMHGIARLDVRDVALVGGDVRITAAPRRPDQPGRPDPPSRAGEPSPPNRLSHSNEGN
jgi:diaminohydroxyphosphoribosylaminopyrimidine deaminase/5-amino-6-(5-phosphoribosylamino)uracil reductase